MEFPFGHHRHHQQRRDEEDEREERRFPPPGQHHHGQPPPPSSYYGGGGAEEEYGRPAHPPVQHVSHGGGARYGETLPQPPAPGYHGGGAEEEYGRPAYPPVQHVTQGYGESRPHLPAGGYHGGGGGGDELHHRRPTPYSSGGRDGCEEEPSRPRQPTVRIFTRAEENYSLSIRDGKVILSRNDPSDPSQHWIKDMKYSTKVKDEEGFPSFSLINKATGEAVKHSIGATHPVRLVPYKPDYLDESVLWTESRDTGDGFRCIRMVNNIRLNFDALHGDKDHGGVRDGTFVVLWEWLKGDNQRWKIVPYSYEKEWWDSVQKRILESILSFWHLTVLNLTIHFGCRDIGINFY
ncbi:unnamed protein product [Musa hybrid cultivar]